MPSLLGCSPRLLRRSRRTFIVVLGFLHWARDLPSEAYLQHVNGLVYLSTQIRRHLGDNEDSKAFTSALNQIQVLNSKSDNYQGNYLAAATTLRLAIANLAAEYEATQACRWDCLVFVWSGAFAIGVAALSSYFNTVI